MQIVIPMSGLGSRFVAAGYNDLKPMIVVDGKTIIEYVIDLFPGDHNFIFVCRADHNDRYDFVNYLPSVCKNSKVVLIQPPYQKLGPVYAALQAKDQINDDEPVMVSYCDYFMKWDFQAFCEEVEKTKEDGNVICYTGFHPHLLHEKNVYAGCLIGENNKLLEIKEKYSFEPDKTKGYHSVGAYYFKSGELMKHYFLKSMEYGEKLNGEFYVSLVYPFLLQDGLDIRVYDKVPHFCQWGTPEDLQEFLYWQSIFKEKLYV